MRVVAVTREGMDYSRGVNDWLREFERRTGREVEVLDPDTREGDGFARTYDVVEYPTIVALAEDGKLLASWRGATMPTIDEVSYYAREKEMASGKGEVRDLMTHRGQKK